MHVWSRWAIRLPSVAIALLVAAPILTLTFSWVSIDAQLWLHLWETQLPQLVANTLLLLGGVAVGVSLIGVTSAWLVTAYDFPGRRFFELAMLLPLAMPAYVLAFVLLGVTDFGSPLQGWWSSTFGVAQIDVRRPFFVIAVLSLVFYPYVYLLARTAFKLQGLRTMEAARTLGMSPLRSFFTIVLPMSRPAIFAGVSLALMETLADFGAVSVFNYNTLTTAIYKAWSGFYSLQTASQLASLLLLFVALVVIGERLSRKGKYSEQAIPPKRRVLSGGRRLSAVAWCSSIVLVAFILPVVQLLHWGASRIEYFDMNQLSALLGKTFLIGFIAAIASVFVASTAVAARFFANSNGLRFIQSFSGLGYALPGSVLAVGIMLVATQLDHWLGKSLLMGSFIVLILAYVIRFYAVAAGPMDAAASKLKPSVIEAAKLFGLGRLQQWRRVMQPLLMPGTSVALLMVMVDVMKEMPATLLLRPFGWDTLAVKIYEFTSEGDWDLAAIPALILILLSLIPMVYLMRKIEGEET